ncbi:hypothetical protein TTHERM_00378800 (macronuclear) [Tetrahymena thermophila SB210]|uniref:TORTIFOLIA1/SINE1-2 N-terminal domain-containing protein n=1 Tax=Tetrahymena thermophila (strain SB210) TaxID=312017 RepID=Q23FD7_TETTS|nr:hypothetical protein TTHERM_00378800 [Tetrahymena thermophila SB210]EAR95216.2 hypothetical protein TTHERM_00378800 [Tetrahymena thermophila SB210]|eukprot:XP_001015461.2 hypothetical protein TTHERM_00378800 [Tetrahymena thermophila SB210]
MKKKFTNIQNIESNNQAYRQAILQSLSKLNDQHTVKTGLEELKDILTNYATDNDRILIAILAIQESNTGGQKMSTKREFIKLIGLLAQIFEEKILDYLPRILAILNKKIKECDSSLQGVVSETFGQLIEYSLRKVDPQVGLRYLQQTVKVIQQNFSHNSATIQQVAAMSLQKIIQSAPPLCMIDMKEEIIGVILDQLRTNKQVNSNLLDSLLALIMGIEDQFRPFVPATIPVLVEHANHSVWNVRKIAVDVIYTLCVFMCDSLEPFIEQIVESLSNCRFDKIKHVRDSATVALNTIKEKLGPQYVEKINQQIEKKPVPSSFHPPTKKVNINNQQQHNKQKPQNLSNENIIIPNESSFRENPHKNNQFKTKQEVERNSASKRGKSQDNNNQSHKNQPKVHQALNKKSINPEFLKNAVKGDVEIKEGKKTPLKSRNVGEQAQQQQVNEQEQQIKTNQDFEQWDMYQKQRQQQMLAEYDEGGQADEEFEEGEEEEQSSNANYQKEKRKIKKANLQLEDIHDQQNEQFDNDIQIFVSGSPPSKAERQRQYQNMINEQQKKQHKPQIIQYNDKHKHHVHQDNYRESMGQQVYQSPNHEVQSKSSPDRYNSGKSHRHQQIIDQERQNAHQIQRNIQKMQQGHKSLNDSLVVNQLAQIEENQARIFERLDFIENDMKIEQHHLHQRIGFLEDTLEKLYQAQAQNQQLNQQFMNYRYQMLQFNQQQQQQQLLKNLYAIQQTPVVNGFFPGNTLDPATAQFMQAQQELLNQQQQQLFPFANFNQAKSNYMQTAQFNSQQSEQQSKNDDNKHRKHNPSPQKNIDSLQSPPNANSQGSNIIHNHHNNYSQQLHQGDDLEHERAANYQEAIKNKKKINKDHLFEQQNVEIQNQKKKQEQSPPKNASLPKQTSPGKKKSPQKQGQEQQAHLESNVIEKINKSISEDKLNEAYGLALTSNDDEILFEVMKSTKVCTNRLDDIHIEFLFSKFKGYLEKLKNVNEILNWINVSLEQKIPISENIKQSLRESLKKMIDNSMDKKDGVLQSRDHHTALKLINQLEQHPGVYNTQQKSFTQISSSNNINTVNIQPNAQTQFAKANSNNNISSLNSAKDLGFLKDDQKASLSLQQNEYLIGIKDNQYKVNSANQNFPAAQQQNPIQNQNSYQNTFPSSTTSNQQVQQYQFTNPEIKRTLDFGSPSVNESTLPYNNYLDKPIGNIGQQQHTQSNNLDYLNSNNFSKNVSLNNQPTNLSSNPYQNSAVASSSLGFGNNLASQANNSLGFGNNPSTVSVTSTQYNTNQYSSSLNPQISSLNPQNTFNTKTSEQIVSTQPYTFEQRQYY